MVLVEKRYPLSAEVRVRFYESWENGDPLTTIFKFEDGTRVHARASARYMCRVIAEPYLTISANININININKRYNIEEYII